jgi:glutathione S-transferase
MAKLEIIGMPQSTFVRAIRMLCAEKGVEYDYDPARPHAPNVAAIHPFGKIPVMRHGDLELCESKAIATYIDRNFDGPKLIPEDPRRQAEAEQWISMVNTTIDPTMVREYVLAYVFAKDGKPDRAVIDAAAEKMKGQGAALDKAVAGGHLVGDSLTFADINLMPILFYVGNFPEGKAMLAANKNLAAFYAKHAERPSFKSTMPPPPPK